METVDSIRSSLRVGSDGKLPVGFSAQPVHTLTARTGIY